MLDELMDYELLEHSGPKIGTRKRPVSPEGGIQERNLNLDRI